MCLNRNTSFHSSFHFDVLNTFTLFYSLYLYNFSKIRINRSSKVSYIIWCILVYLLHYSENTEGLTMTSLISRSFITLHITFKRSRDKYNFTQTSDLLGLPSPTFRTFGPFRCQPWLSFLSFIKTHQLIY